MSIGYKDTAELAYLMEHDYHKYDNDNTEPCYECENSINKDYDKYEVYDDEIYCENCTTTCDECNADVPKSELAEVTDSDGYISEVCPDCLRKLENAFEEWEAMNCKETQADREYHEQFCK